MCSNHGANTARNYDYQHRYFAHLMVEMLDCRFRKVICEWEEDLEAVTNEGERILIQQTTKGDYLEAFSLYDAKVIKSVAKFYLIYTQGKDIRWFWFVSNVGIKGMDSSSSSTLSNLYKDKEQLRTKIAEYLNQDIDEKSFGLFLEKVEAKRYDFDKVASEARTMLGKKYGDLTIQQLDSIFEKIYEIAKQACRESDISKKVTDGAFQPNYDKEKERLTKESRTITKDGLEANLGSIVARITSIPVNFKEIEEMVKAELQRLGLANVGFRVVTQITEFNDGDKACWKEGFFTDEDVKSDYDARRGVTDPIIDSIKNKQTDKVGALILGKAFSGKSVLLRRLMFELISEAYCVLHANDISASEYQLKELFENISSNNVKFLVIVDDVHKKENEVIFNLVTSNTNESISFVLAGRTDELNILKPEIKRALNKLKNHFLNFSEEDASEYLKKMTSIYPESSPGRELHGLAKTLYAYSKRDPVTYNCVLRSILSSGKVEGEPFSFEMSVDAIKDCVCSDVRNQISRLEDLKNQGNDLWRPHMLVSILGMFGINLNTSKNMDLINCCEVIPYQLDSLVNYGFIMKDKLNNYFSLHEIRAEEFLTYLFREHYKNDATSFNVERQIQLLLKCIYESISTEEITTLLNRCLKLYKDDRTQFLAKLIAESYEPPIGENGMKEAENNQKLADLYCYGLGDYYLVTGDITKALTFYDKSIRMDPDNLSYYIHKGVKLDNNGMHEIALNEYQKAMSINPNNSDLWYNKGVALFNMSRFQESIEAYDKALRINPKDVDAINNKGRSLILIGELEDALQQFDEALNIDPDFYFALLNKGWVLAMSNNKTQALDYIEKAIRINPSDGNSWYVKGMFLYENENYEDALQAFEEATRLSPTVAIHWYRKGLVFHTLHKYDEAINSYEEAIKLEPKLYQAISDKGNSHLSLGQGDEALAAFNRALTLNPNDPIMWYNKAVTYFKMGDLKAATKFASKATDLAENYVSAWTLQIMSQTQLGNNDEALNAAMKLKRIDKNDTFEGAFVNRHDQSGQIFSKRSSYE